MHVLVLKLITPNSSYRLLKLSTTPSMQRKSNLQNQALPCTYIDKMKIHTIHPTHTLTHLLVAASCVCQSFPDLLLLFL